MFKANQVVHGRDELKAQPALFKAYFELGMPVLVRMMMRVLAWAAQETKRSQPEPRLHNEAFKDILGRMARFVHSILLGFMKYKVPSILLAAVQD